jgi:hypothetical protein
MRTYIFLYLYNQMFTFIRNHLHVHFVCFLAWAVRKEMVAWMDFRVMKWPQEIQQDIWWSIGVGVCNRSSVFSFLGDPRRSSSPAKSYLKCVCKVNNGCFLAWTDPRPEEPWKFRCDVVNLVKEVVRREGHFQFGKEGTSKTLSDAWGETLGAWDTYLIYIYSISI